VGLVVIVTLEVLKRDSLYYNMNQAINVSFWNLIFLFFEAEFRCLDLVRVRWDSDIPCIQVLLNAI
jgi:hypothetical protein